jgi:hypothetical protein
MDREPTTDTTNNVIWAIIGVAAVALIVWAVWSLLGPSNNLPGVPNTGTPTSTNPGAGTPGPSQVTQAQSGATLVYARGASFEAVLDPTQSPAGSLACAPAGIVSRTTPGSILRSGLYSTEFKALAPGTCTLRSGAFSATIIVTQ